MLYSASTVHDGIHSHQQLTVVSVDQPPPVFLDLDRWYLKTVQELIESCYAVPDAFSGSV